MRRCARFACARRVRGPRRTHGAAGSKEVIGGRRRGGRRRRRDRHSRGKRIAGAQALEQPNWHEFSPPDHSFTCQIPGPTKPQNIKRSTPLGDVELRGWISAVGSTGATTVAYIDFPSALEQKILVSQLLESTLDGAIRESKMKVVGDRRWLTVEGNQALEVDGQVEDSKSTGLGTVRVWIALPNRVYMMGVYGDASSEIYASREMYLASFKSQRR